MLRDNQGAKKDLGDGKSATKGIEDVKCVMKYIERIREEQQLHHKKVSPNLHMNFDFN